MAMTPKRRPSMQAMHIALSVRPTTGMVSA